MKTLPRLIALALLSFALVTPLIIASSRKADSRPAIDKATGHFSTVHPVAPHLDAHYLSRAFAAVSR